MRARFAVIVAAAAATAAASYGQPFRGRRAQCQPCVPSYCVAYYTYPSELAACAPDCMPVDGTRAGCPFPDLLAAAVDDPLALLSKRLGERFDVEVSETGESLKGLRGRLFATEHADPGFEGGPNAVLFEARKGQATVYLRYTPEIKKLGQAIQEERLVLHVPGDGPKAGEYGIQLQGNGSLAAFKREEDPAKPPEGFDFTLKDGVVTLEKNDKLRLVLASVGPAAAPPPPAKMDWLAADRLPAPPGVPGAGHKPPLPMAAGGGERYFIRGSEVMLTDARGTRVAGHVSHFPVRGSGGKIQVLAIGKEGEEDIFSLDGRYLGNFKDLRAQYNEVWQRPVEVVLSGGRPGRKYVPLILLGGDLAVDKDGQRYQHVYPDGVHGVYRPIPAPELPARKPASTAPPPLKPPSGSKPLPAPAKPAAEIKPVAAGELRLVDGRLLNPDGVQVGREISVVVHGGFGTRKMVLYQLAEAPGDWAYYASDKDGNLRRLGGKELGVDNIWSRPVVDDNGRPAGARVLIPIQGTRHDAKGNWASIDRQYVDLGVAELGDDQPVAEKGNRYWLDLRGSVGVFRPLPPQPAEPKPAAPLAKPLVSPADPPRIAQAPDPRLVPAAPSDPEPAAMPKAPPPREKPAPAQPVALDPAPAPRLKLLVAPPPREKPAPAQLVALDPAPAPRVKLPAAPLPRLASGDRVGAPGGKAVLRPNVPNLEDVDELLKELREAHDKGKDASEILADLRQVSNPARNGPNEIANKAYLAWRLRQLLYESVQPGTAQPLGFSLDVADLYVHADWAAVGRWDWDRQEAPKAVVALFGRLPAGPSKKGDWAWEDLHVRLSGLLGDMGGIAIPAIERRRGKLDAKLSNEDFWLNVAHVQALGLALREGPWPKARPQDVEAVRQLLARVRKLEQGIGKALEADPNADALGLGQTKAHRGNSALESLPERYLPEDD